MSIKIKIIDRLKNLKLIDTIKSGFDAILDVWYREYKLMFSDISLITMFIIVFLLYPFIYPLPFYKGHDVVRKLPIAVIDEDKSSLSRMFIRMADANENMQITVHSNSLQEAKKDFLENRVNGIIVIPRGFHNDIYSNQQTVVSVYCDASYFYIYKQVLTGVKYVATYMSAGIQIKKFQTKGLSQPAALAAREPVTLVSYPLFNPGNSYTNYLIPAVLILILQQTLLLGVGIMGGLSYEKKRYHYFLPTVSVKGGIYTIVLGKAGAYLSLFLVHAVYIFGVIFRFHGLPMKSDILTLMIFITPFLLAVIFLAMSLSTVFRSREMAMLLLLCTSIPFILVSGFSWPMLAMPDWIKGLALLLPSTSGIDGFLKICVLGGSLRDVMFNWIQLWGLVLLYFFLSVFALKTIIKKSSHYMDGQDHENI